MCGIKWMKGYGVQRETYRKAAKISSEGRGHRFVSCRVRHFQTVHSGTKMGTRWSTADAQPTLATLSPYVFQQRPRGHETQSLFFAAALRMASKPRLPSFLAHFTDCRLVRKLGIGRKRFPFWASLRFAGSHQPSAASCRGDDCLVPALS